MREAIAAFQRALHLRPAYFEALRNLGLAQQQAGRPVEAIAALRGALADIPLTRLTQSPARTLESAA